MISSFESCEYIVSINDGNNHKLVFSKEYNTNIGKFLSEGDILKISRKLPDLYFQRKIVNEEKNVIQCIFQSETNTLSKSRVKDLMARNNWNLEAQSQQWM